MRRLFYFLIVIELFSCGGPQSKIPKDVKYEIISEERNDAISKCNIEIQLNKRVNEQVLKNIAMVLRKNRKRYEKIWIFYMLPDMESDYGAWAYTHFTPDLEIKIQGSTEEEHKMLDEVPMPEGEIIGKWQDEDPLVESVKIIYKMDGKLKIQTTYYDGSQSDDELIEKKENGKIRYDFLDNSRGEYYIIEDNGNLGMYGENGKFMEAKKIE